MKHNHISSRHVLCLTGSDRFSFLQGLITADLNELKSGQMKLSALLSPQGKIRYLFYIFCTEDALYLDCHEEQAPSLLKHLLMFTLRADITLSETELNVYAGSKEAPPPAEARIIADCKSVFITGWRALSPVLPIIPGDGNKNWLKRRLQAGVPEIMDITIDKTIALEANLDCLGAISWTKGCYMGQEVTARSHYRGLIKKRLVPVTLLKGEFPKQGGFLTSGDAPPMPLLSRFESSALVMIPRALWGNTEPSHDGLTYEGESVLITYPEGFTKVFSPEGPLS